jgi:isocitrate lyase
MGGKVLVPTREAVAKLSAARLASDVMGTPTVLLARTDAEAGDLVTSDIDDNDKPFCTGERTVEGFFRTRNGLEQAISRGLAYGYARNNMSAFVELQESEFAAAEKGFTAVKHQREVGTGYFDAVTTTIERDASTGALKGSTEDEQFFDKKHA